MLEFLVYFFIKFADVLGLVVQWLGGFVQDTVYLISLAQKFLVNIPSVFNWLPSASVRLLVSLFSIVVVYKVLGREG